MVNNLKPDASKKVKTNKMSSKRKRSMRRKPANTSQSIVSTVLPSNRLAYSSKINRDDSKMISERKREEK